MMVLYLIILRTVVRNALKRLENVRAGGGTRLSPALTEVSTAQPYSNRNVEILYYDKY